MLSHGGKISPARTQNMTRIDTGDAFRIDNRAINSRRNHTRPVAIAGFIILCFVAWLALEIPKGIITDTDELLTAERSREMLLTSPWVVHFIFNVLLRNGRCSTG
jgi:hypothetical protein